MEGRPPAGHARVRGPVPLAGLALVLAVGLAANLAPWRQTFTPEGVRFRGDTDPYYHALRARRMLADWPRVPWRDPDMDYPDGADILWPPLFDASIAAIARLAGTAPDATEALARIAALVPVAFGLLLLASVAALGRALLGQGGGMVAALLVALLPASLRFSSVGATDQHVAEALFATWMALAFVRAWDAPPGGPARAWTALLGVSTALAFWNWQGSAVALAPLALFAAAWHVAGVTGSSPAPRVARTLARGCGGAAVALGVTVAAWGPPGAFTRASLAGIGGNQVAVCAATATFGALLAAAHRWRAAAGPPGRAGDVALAAAAAAAALLLPRSTRLGLAHGLTALAAASPWHRTIEEFRPLFAGADSPAAVVVASMAGFGLCLLAAPAGAWALARWWRREPAARSRVAFLALWGALFLLLALGRKRFVLYLVVPLALWCEVAVREAVRSLARRAGRRRRLAASALGAGLVLLLVLPALPMVWMATYAAQDPLIEEVLVPLARRLPAMPAPADRPAILASWNAGHVLRYFAGRPVVATPFGTDLGPAGLRDLAEFQFSTDPERVEALLARRRVGLVLLRAPAVEGWETLGQLVTGVPAPFARARDGRGLRPWQRPGYTRLVTSRLYHLDGLAPGDDPAPTLDAFRLLAESDGDARDHGAELPGPPYKVFGVVPGARLVVRGLAPGAEIVATARVLTNRGRWFGWGTSSVADAGGSARLRLPYATGPNGLSHVEPYVVFEPGRPGRPLGVGEAQVLGGATLELDLRR